MSRIMSYLQPRAKIIPGTAQTGLDNHQGVADHVAEEDEFGGVSYNDEEVEGEYMEEMEEGEGEEEYYYFEPGYLGQLKMAIRNLSVPCLIESMKWLTDSAVLSCSISVSSDVSRIFLHLHILNLLDT